MSERRTNARARAFMQGRIIFNNGATTLDCTVREYSDTGARIECSGAVTLPDRFELFVPRKGLTRPARIAWRRDGQIGVEFIDQSESAIASPGAIGTLEERVAHLEFEVARLSALLLHLQTWQAGAEKSGSPARAPAETATSRRAAG